eukprot:scaffold32458_cov59-Phaeocystis_antarctica.AAC.3
MHHHGGRSYHGGEGLLDEVTDLEDAKECPAHGEHHRQRRPAQRRNEYQRQRAHVDDQETTRVPG